LIVTLGFTFACAWRIHKVLILSKHYRLYLQSTPILTNNNNNNSNNSNSLLTSWWNRWFYGSGSKASRRGRGVIELESSNMSFDYTDTESTTTDGINNGNINNKDSNNNVAGGSNNKRNKRDNVWDITSDPSVIESSRMESTDVGLTPNHHNKNDRTVTQSSSSVMSASSPSNNNNNNSRNETAANTPSNSGSTAHKHSISHTNTTSSGFVGIIGSLFPWNRRGGHGSNSSNNQLREHLNATQNAHSICRRNEHASESNNTNADNSFTFTYPRDSSDVTNSHSTSSFGHFLRNGAQYRDPTVVSHTSALSLSSASLGSIKGNDLMSANNNTAGTRPHGSMSPSPYQQPQQQQSSRSSSTVKSTTVSPFVRSQRSNNQLIEAVSDSNQIRTPSINKTVSNSMLTVHADRSQQTSKLASTAQATATARRNNNYSKDSNSNSRTNSSTMTSTVNNNNSNALLFSKEAVIIGDVDMDCPGLADVADEPSMIPNTDRANNVSADTSGESVFIPDINSATNSAQAEALIEEMLASTVDGKGCIESIHRITVNGGTQNTTESSIDNGNVVDPQEAEIRDSVMRLSMRYSVNHQDNHDSKPNKTAISKDNDKSGSYNNHSNHQMNIHGDSRDAFDDGEEGDNYGALFILFLKLLFTCGGALDYCNLVPYNNKNDSNNNSSHHSDGNDDASLDPPGQTGASSKRTEVLRSLNLLRAIWHFNGRSMMMVIAYGINNIVGIPLLIMTFIVNFNKFVNENTSFYNCLVNASLEAPVQTQDEVNTYSKDVCGSIPNHRPSYIMVSRGYPICYDKMAEHTHDLLLSGLDVVHVGGPLPNRSVFHFWNCEEATRKRCRDRRLVW
jgi:hypothetical protein